MEEQAVEECVFCKIVRGELSGMKVFEDEWTMAFMDLAKDVDGHILVIPKKHCKNVLDCDYDTMNHVMNTVKKVSNHLVENCGYDGVNVLSNNNSAADQSVMHMHIHIIPRKKDDGLKIFPSYQQEMDLDKVFKEMKM